MPASPAPLRQPSPLEDYLFDLRGFLILKNAIAPDLLARLNAEFDRFPLDMERGAWYRGAQRRDYGVKSGLELHNCIEIGGPFEELIDNPAWLAYVQKYCGEQNTYVEGLFIDECFASIRNEGGSFDFHSGGCDGALRGKYHYANGFFRCGQVNVLMAITEFGPGNGGTLIIPGSHKSNLPIPSQDELKRHATEVRMDAGDVVLFVDGATHGGSDRTNPGSRRAIVYRYGPSWGRQRFGYEYSRDLLDRLTPQRRAILEPVPPCCPGDDWIPVEAPVVAKRAREAENSL